MSLPSASLVSAVSDSPNGRAVQTDDEKKEAGADAEGRAALPIEGGQDARYHFHMVAERGSDPLLAESQTSNIMTMLQRLESKVDALMMRGDRQLLAPKRTAEPAEPEETLADSLEEAVAEKRFIRGKRLK